MANDIIFPLEKVTRLEVIDDTGRVYTCRPCTVQVSIQDNERTLKIFVLKGEKHGIQSKD